ncbi:four helix bundle protein [Desulfospira joergensenii]|uniref:four helix bundle protein n=1 Tax=Desulfospira joergensenii TaxID=53329 RepID=UPI0003B7AFCF|nr:four helix bundle protein [Desulfospira joergensenii]
MSSSFEGLEVWKKSCRLAVKVYKILAGCKDFGLKDQMQRAAVSIPSNIAEGKERNSDAEFKRFLKIAKGSAAELRTQLYISKEINIISETVSKELLREVKEISKMLQGLISSV